MKTIYKVSWDVFVKASWDDEDFEIHNKSQLIENKTDALEFKRKIDDAFILLGMPPSMRSSTVEEVSLK
jgi:hypothetical protein